MTPLAEFEEVISLREAEDYLLKSYEIGREVEGFMSSTAGRLVMGRAIEEVSAAIQVLLETDPAKSPEKAAAAQHRAASARRALHWLYSAVADGEQAEQVLLENFNDTQTRQ